jgi:LmbE family N-acetylglucosaminyl deacetylase
MTNLIIAAHPDDEILGCGGLLTAMKKNAVDSYVLILTAGADTRYEKEMEQFLAQNARKAGKIVGVREIFIEDLPNQQLDTIPVLKITRTIERYIEKLEPDTIFTHHAGDLNKDHRLVYEASVTAARPLPGQIVKRIYTYSVASSTEWAGGDKTAFAPNVFVDITAEIDTKIEAMKCYESECRPYPHPRSPEAVKCYAHYWGLTAGVEYAEPYKLIRDIRKGCL